MAKKKVAAKKKPSGRAITIVSNDCRLGFYEDGKLLAGDIEYDDIRSIFSALGITMEWEENFDCGLDGEWPDTLAEALSVTAEDEDDQDDD